MKPQELHPLFVRRCPHRNKDANQSRCIQSRVTVPVRMNLLVNVIFHPSPKPEAPRLLLYPYTPTTVLIHSNPAAKILTSLSDRPRRYILPRCSARQTHTHHSGHSTLRFSTLAQKPLLTRISIHRASAPESGYSAMPPGLQAIDSTRSTIFNYIHI
jgi:hypothetical protein